jgi:hypothetical protein
MPKKQKADNFDAIGSIFDFLFAESRKRPDRRRPITPTGVSSESEMADAMIASLARPATFMSNAVVDEFNRSLDLQLGVVQIDKEKIKVSSNTLIDFIKDPQKVIQKALTEERAARASNRAAFMGETVTDFVATGWARKYGDIEAQKAVYGAVVAKKSVSSYSIAKAMGESHLRRDKHGDIDEMIHSKADYGYMANRSTELLRRELVSDNEWNSWSNDDREKFMTSIVKENNLGTTDLKDFLLAKYGATRGTQLHKDYLSLASFKKDSKTITKNTLIVPIVYQKLENRNIDRRIDELNSLGVRTAEQQNQLEVYKKTKFLLNRDLVKLRTEEKRIKDQIKITTDSNYKKVLQKELKDTKQAIRVIGAESFMGKIGKWEGQINAIKGLNGIYGGITLSEVVPSMIKGDYFNEEKNALSPSTYAEINIGPAFVPLPVAKKEKSAILTSHNEFVTGIHYLTPTSIFRTLTFNGEGFVYLLYKRMDKRNDIKSLLEKGLGEKHNTANLVGLILGKNFSEFSSLHGSKFNASELGLLEDLFKKNRGSKSVINFFSYRAKIHASIQKKINSALAPLRRKFAEKYLMKFATKYGGSQLLGQWVATGSLKVLFRSLAVGIAGALGIVATPLGSVVITALTWVITDLALKTFGFAINVGKYALAGLIVLPFLLLFIASGSLKNFNKTNFSYYNTVPAEVIQCSAYEETEIGEGEDLPWSPAIIPPPTGETCIIGSGTFGCSQGWVNVGTWSHRRITHLMPVDLTGVNYIYAPQFCSGSGNCKITRIARINCGDGSDAGGIVEFTATNVSTTYFFKLLHVQPLAALGQALSPGQPVAVVQSNLKRGNCWTGKHLHYENRQNGAVVDPLELLRSFNCNVPRESQCSRPR